MDKKQSMPDSAAHSYRDSLERVEHALAEVEVRSWQALQEEVDRAVAFEQDAERLTAEQASLLSTYIQRDIRGFMEFLRDTGRGLREWLRFDLELLEEGVRRSMLQIADRTRLEQLQLEHQLQHEEGTYVAGEVTFPGLLQCTDCGKMMCLVEAATIEPCHRCDNVYFRRITGRP